jgi:N-acetylglutamate synthase-like GNAT family acetyltransferase
MLISYLADHPEFIPVLAPAIVEHWRFVIPDDTVESRIAKLEKQMNRDTLPIGWVAHADGEVFGTASLRVHDLKGREDLTPWLGGVFVRPEYRRRGAASTLCRAVEDKAWSLGFEVLYLFTPDQQSLYARLGWRNLEQTVWRGLESDIMIKRKEAV